MKPIGLVARDTGPQVSFEIQKEARAFKSELKRLTQDNSAYYSVLARFELGHFNQIPEVAAEAKQEPAELAKRVLTALQMEVNAQTWAASENAPVPAKTGKLFMAFTSDKAFEEVRDHLRILTGNDDFYLKTMRAFGYEKASDIPTHEAGIKPYRELCIERNRVQMEHETVAAAARQVGPERAREVIETLRKTYELLGTGPFFAVLDKFGCPTIDEAIRSYRLAEIMTELKECVDYRNRK